MIYYVLAISIFFSSFLEVSRFKKLDNGINSLNKVYIYVLFPAILICLGGFRWLTGTDWFSYYNYFTFHKTWAEFNNRQFELIFSFLNFLCKQISDKYTFFLIVFSFLVISLKYLAIRRIKGLYLSMSCFLLYCYTTGDIFAVRQDLAISFFVLSLPFLIQKKAKKFLLIIAMASLIHHSALICFFVYPIYWKKSSFLRHSRKNDIYLMFICCVIGLMGKFFYSNMFSFILSNVPFFKIKIIEKFFVYAGYGGYKTNYLSVCFSLIKRIIVLPILFIYEKKISKQYRWYSGIFSLYIWGSCIYFLFLTDFQVFQRLTIYFQILECILLPQVFFVMKKSNKKVFIVFLFLYGFFKLYKSLSAFSYLKIPYYSIFNYENRSMDWRGELL